MDPNTILQMLADRGLAPAFDGASSADVVKGHTTAWGGEGNLYPIRPYTLTPAALESFTVRERSHVAIDGRGEDVVDLHGLGIYRRHDPRAAEGRELDWAGA